MPTPRPSLSPTFPRKNTPPTQGELLHFAFPHCPKIHCVFTTALWGNMSFANSQSEQEKAETMSNRKHLLSTLHVPKWSELLQVHGTSLIINPKATEVSISSSLQADGQATNQSDLALTIKTADCQPLLLAHNKGRFVAALHVGWRGNAQNFIKKAVHELCEAYASKPVDILAVRGPSLGPGHAEFINFAQEWGEEFTPWYNSMTKTMHLWLVTKHQLMQSGLKEKNIFALDLCTYGLHPWFFSHRCGSQGRQMALIWQTQ